MIEVAITGAGAVTSAGLGVERLWRAARDGQACVSRLRSAKPDSAITQVAGVDAFEPEAHFSESELRALDRFSQFALVAAREAVAHAGLSEAELRGARTAVLFGSGMGGAQTIDSTYQDLLVHGRARGNPLAIPRIMVNAAASQIAMRYGVTGPVTAVSTACASAAQAIGMALMMIRSGLVDRAIAGGSEAMLTLVIMKAWEALHVLTPTVTRPFSKGRNGMLIGEGAGALVLERADFARARGARPWGRLCGYGTSSDAGDLLRPSSEGAAAAIRSAIADAGISARDLRYVNAHGTGTVHNDLAEAAAIRSVLGDGVAVSSTKPIHGHTIGAAGAVELIVTLFAIRNDFAPPTINWLGPDENCPIDPVPNSGRSLKIDYAMSNSLAFGGINAALIVAKA